MRQALRVMIKADHGALSQLQRALGELQRTATESTERPATPSGVTPVQVIEPPVDFTNMVWLGSQGVLFVGGQLALILFLVYFLLAYGDLFKLKLVRISGERLSQRRVTVQLIDQIGESVQRSMSHLMIASLAVGFITWGAMHVMKVNYAGLWGLAAGLMNFVPYVGPAAVAVGLFFATMLQWGDIPAAFGVASVSMVITTLEGFLFTPIVFGRSVKLNPVAIFIAFMFWGWLWGIWGMLLAMPLLMIMKTVSDSVEGLGPLSELLSD
jgi:predicted PurR-regulated permease PerM